MRNGLVEDLVLEAAWASTRSGNALAAAAAINRRRVAVNCMASLFR
jgi:hypothetical protein